MNDQEDAPQLPVRLVVDKNNQVSRRVKRLLCRHKYLWEYQSFEKIQFCPKCGAHGKASPK